MRIAISLVILSVMLLGYLTQVAPFSSNEIVEPYPSQQSISAVLTDPTDLIEVKIDGAQPGALQGSDWLSLEIRDLFDYFISFYEDGESAMWERFTNYCAPRQYCPALHNLFFRYVEYKVQLQSLDSDIALTAEDHIDRMARAEDLQRELFSLKEKNILFQAQSKWDHHAMQRLKIRQDETLNEADKSALLAVHFEQLPEQLKEAVQPSVQLQKVVNYTAINEQLDYNELAAEFGPEAAQRLIDLEEAQRDWKQRVSNYQSVVEQLTADVDDVSGEEVIGYIKNKYFNLTEQKRLKVFLANPSLMQ